jgi:hypothetical protein
MIVSNHRPGVLVLGMHRSGTSALTGLLSLHGLALPQDMLAGKPENPLGFFESTGIVRFDDRVLAAVGSSWHDPSPLPDPLLPPEALERHVEEAAAILRCQWPDEAPFIMKDPRLCRLLPVWLPALARTGARPIAILAIRNPLEVAQSLAIRNSIGQPDAHRLWLAHVLAAERDTRRIPRAVVHYDDLLRDWRAVLAGLGVGIEGERAAATDAFLSRNLRHHAADTDALLRDAAVPTPIKRVYAELRRAPGEPGLDPAVFDAAGRSHFLRAAPPPKSTGDAAGA